MELQLKKLRKKAGLTQSELSEITGIKLGTLRTWEQGVSSIRLDDACTVCEALGCTPNDLCGWYIDHPEDIPQASAPPGLTPPESELLGNYRASAPQWRQNIAMTARAAAGESKEVAEPAALSVEEAEGAA